MKTFLLMTGNDLHETDELRILDYSGDRAFKLFRFSELGKAHIHEPAASGQPAS